MKEERVVRFGYYFDVVTNTSEKESIPAQVVNQRSVASLVNKMAGGQRAFWAQNTKSALRLRLGSDFWRYSHVFGQKKDTQEGYYSWLAVERILLRKGEEFLARTGAQRKMINQLLKAIRDEHNNDCIAPFSADATHDSSVEESETDISEDGDVPMDGAPLTPATPSMFARLSAMITPIPPLFSSLKLRLIWSLAT